MMAFGNVVIYSVSNLLFVIFNQYYAFSCNNIGKLFGLGDACEEFDQCPPRSLNFLYK